MLTRHATQVLRKAGHTQAEVATLVGVSEREVRRVEQEPPVEDLDPAAERQRRGIGRPSKAEPFRDKVAALLKEEPGLLSVEILGRMQLEGYAGAKTAMYALVRSLCSEDARLMVRFVKLPT